MAGRPPTPFLFQLNSAVPLATHNFNRSAMDLNGDTAVNSRKRKNTMDRAAETVAEQQLLTPHPSQPGVRYFPCHQPMNSPSLVAPSRLDLNLRPPGQSSYAPENNAADLYTQYRATSFTSLLTGIEDTDFIPPYVTEQNAYLDQLITTQGNQLRRSLGEVQRRQYCFLSYEAEERAAKKLKEKELELNEMAAAKRAEWERKEATLKKEINSLKKMVKHLENSTASLRAQLQESIILGGRFESGGCSYGNQDDREDVESAHVDPERVEPVMLVCKACGKMANIMLWPCRHVCACNKCDDSIIRCPVCDVLKNTSVEIALP